MEPWSTLTQAVLAALAVIRDGNQFTKERKDQALSSLYLAAGQTRSYVENLQSSGIRDRSKEAGLSNLWKLASIPMRHFDEDLARRFELKGSYWKAPDEWTVAAITGARIGLERIEKESEYMLRLRIRPKKRKSA